jgi:hypothetical protein
MHSPDVAVCTFEFEDCLLRLFVVRDDRCCANVRLRTALDEDGQSFTLMTESADRPQLNSIKLHCERAAFICPHSSNHRITV